MASKKQGGLPTPFACVSRCKSTAYESSTPPTPQRRGWQETGGHQKKSTKFQKLLDTPRICSHSSRHEQHCSKIQRMKTGDPFCTELTDPSDTYQSYWHLYGREVERNKSLGYRTAVTPSCGTGFANLFRWNGYSLEVQRQRGIDIYDIVNLELIMPELLREVSKVFPEAIRQHFAV